MQKINKECCSAQGKGGGGGGSTTTVQQADPWTGLQPYLKEGFTSASQLYGSGGLSTAPYQGNTVAPLSADTQAALDFTRQRALSGSPLVSQAQQQAFSTLSGDYLAGGNPYLANALTGSLRPTVENFRDAVMPSIEARAAQSGRYGSGAMQDQQGKAYDALARNIAEASTNAYAQNYEQERARQAQAMLLTPQLAAEDYKDAERLAAVGDYYDQYQQSLINQDVMRYEQERDAPYNALSRYMSLLQAGPSGIGSSSSTTSGGGQRSNPLLGALGGAASGFQTFGPVGGLVGGLLGAFL